MVQRRALWIGATLLLVAVLALFAYRPTPIVGADQASLAHSIGSGIEGERCLEEADDWRCEIWDSQQSGNATYDVKLDGLGCWDAERIGRGGEGGTPPRLSGCVNALDHLRLWNVIS